MLKSQSGKKKTKKHNTSGMKDKGKRKKYALAKMQSENITHCEGRNSGIKPRCTTISQEADSDEEAKDTFNPFEPASSGKLSNKKIPNYTEVRDRANTIQPIVSHLCHSLGSQSTEEQTQEKELDDLQMTFKAINTVKQMSVQAMMQISTFPN